MGRWIAAGMLGLALMMPVRVGAQGEVTGQVWTDFLLDWYFRSDHLAELEVGPKVLFSGGEAWSELTLTPAYEWVAGPRFELVVRTLFSWVRQNKDISTFEVRPVLGFRLYMLQSKAHRAMIRDFNRVESRNLWYLDTGEEETTWRYRNRLELQLAINHKHLADAHTLYLLSDFELFVNLGRATAERFNDNWRYRVGLGYRIKYEWRVELLYTLQTTRDTLESQFQVSNNIIRLRIKFYPRSSLHQVIASRRARN